METIVKDVVAQTLSDDQRKVRMVVQGKRNRGRGKRPNYDLQPRDQRNPRQPADVRTAVAQYLGPRTQGFHPVSLPTIFLVTRH